MKNKLQILFCLMAALLVTSCQGSSYRYQIIEFKNSLGKVVAEGAAKPEVFKGVFEPAIYIGPHIDIPKDANVFGVLILMREEARKALPLYTWQDEAGNTRAGCNGPAPQFAHHATTKEELIQSLARMLAVDEGHREEGALSKAAEEGSDWDRARKLLTLKAEDVQAGPTLEERGARQYPYPIVGDTISVERDGWNYSWRIKAPENGELVLEQLESTRVRTTEVAPDQNELDREPTTVDGVVQSLAKELSGLTEKYPELASYKAAEANRGDSLFYSHNFEQSTQKRGIKNSDFGEYGCFIGFSTAPIPPKDRAYAMAEPKMELENLGLYMWAEVRTGATPSKGFQHEIQELLSSHAEMLRAMDSKKGQPE